MGGGGRGLFKSVDTLGDIEVGCRVGVTGISAGSSTGDLRIAASLAYGLDCDFVAGLLYCRGELDVSGIEENFLTDHCRDICSSSDSGELSWDVRGVSTCDPVWDSTIDCLDDDEVSVLLLLSPRMPCNGRMEGVLAEESASPVIKSLVNASMPSGALILSVDDFRDAPGRPSPSSSNELVSLGGTFFWKGFDGIPSVLCAFGGTD